MFDIDAYLARIGYDGDLHPNLEVLRALIQHHEAAVPFENIDVACGRPVLLDPASLMGKLVGLRRGGYCCEQNTLFKAALDAVGFQTAALLARVRRGFPRDVPRPRTHMLLRVGLPGGAWLADVGFGGLTPTAPVLMTHDQEQATPHEMLRLIPHDGESLLQARLGEAWEDVYQFTNAPQLPIDFEVANWFTSAHPMSPFRNNVIVTRPVQGGRLVLFNRVFSRRGVDGTAEKRTITAAAEYRQLLDEAFGIGVPAEDVDALMALLDRQGPVAFDPFS